jgi:hypothetical protein
MTWYNVSTPDEVDRLESAWSGAPIENVETISALLDVARIQVMAFAADDDAPALQVAELLRNFGATPTTIATILAVLQVPGSLAVDGVFSDDFSAAFAVDPEPPTRYVYAQLQQAQNLWNAGATSSDGSLGADGYSFVPRPLDKTIRQIIRPTTGAASVY